MVPSGLALIEQFKSLCRCLTAQDCAQEFGIDRTVYKLVSVFDSLQDRAQCLVAIVYEFVSVLDTDSSRLCLV